MDAEEKAELKIISANMRTIIYYYQQIDKRIENIEEKTEKIEEKLGIIMRRE